jgi:hypothetical protein
MLHPTSLDLRAVDATPLKARRELFLAFILH